MATRIKDWEIPYTWGVGIEITDNHVINLLLREANNLIHVNEDNEVYVDLQLPDGIQPDDDFPVGVTTGKILQEDWWQQSWLILNWKTTSWDYARLIYANDWNVYIDIGDGVWILIWWWDMFSNVREFTVSSLDDATAWQQVIDWYLAWNYPIVLYNGNTYLLMWDHQATQQLVFINADTWQQHYMNRWYSYISRARLRLYWDAQNQFEEWETETISKSWHIIYADMGYTTPFIPQTPWDPTTKKYVDDELAKKQDILTPWTRITITVDPNTWDTIISADVSGVMTYMWNVSSVSDLANIQNPNQWDCWYVEWSHTMYAWDWTQWNDIGGTGIDLTNYFNKQTDDTDDITQWTNNLFVSPVEKNTWNNKQDKLTAWNNITIDNNNVISATSYIWWDYISITGNKIDNDAPFIPENAWVLWQVLEKTSTWYRWNNPATWVTSVNGRTWVVTVEEFDPENTGSTGQVLKKTFTGYQWANESWGGGGWHTYYEWDGIDITNYTITNTKPFEPDTWWSIWDVLVKTANGYDWETLSANGNIKLFVINSSSNTTIDNTVVKEAVDWFNAGKLPIIKGYSADLGWDRFFIPNEYWVYGNDNFIYFNAIFNENDTVIDTAEWVSYWGIPTVAVRYNWNTITYSNITRVRAAWGDFISPTHNYQNPYTPSFNGSPATKKYVDDHDTVVSGDSGTTYTIKVSNSNPASWTANNVITFVL